VLFVVHETLAGIVVERRTVHLPSSTAPARGTAFRRCAQGRVSSRVFGEDLVDLAMGTSRVLAFNPAKSRQEEGP
jgi:hypothetical protein